MEIAIRVTNTPFYFNIGTRDTKDSDFPILFGIKKNIIAMAGNLHFKEYAAGLPYISGEVIRI